MPFTPTMQVDEKALAHDSYNHFSFLICRVLVSLRDSCFKLLNDVDIRKELSLRETKTRHKKRKAVV